MHSSLRAIGIVAGIAALLSLAACKESDDSDHGPHVSDIQVNPDDTRISVGQTAALTISASGTDLQFEWRAERGQLSSNSAPAVVYTAAAPAGKDMVTVKVTGAGGTTVKTRTFEVTEAVKVPDIAAVPQSGGVSLTSHRDKDVVPCEILAQGRYSADIQNAIWPVVWIGGLYYPQDEGGHAPLMTDGEWSGTVRFGDCKKPEETSGKAFKLFVFTADQQANAAFETYLKTAEKAGHPGLPTLPQGLKRHVYINVKRQ